MMKKFTLLAVVFMLFSLSLQAQNLMVTGDANPDFEGYGSADDNVYWWFRQVNGGAATMTSVTTSPQSGSRCFQATVTTMPPNPYDIQTINTASGTTGGNGYYTLAANTSYTLRFWAKADANGKQINALMQNSGYSIPDVITSGTMYGVTLTNAWQLYEVVFKSTAAGGYRPVFQFGYATGTYNVDNVQFYLSSTVPVELMAFNVNQNTNKAVDLTWQVAQELRLKDYTVQRSLDGKKFDDISVVSAKNSAAMTKYAFQDESPINGVNYYRLKINEQDGTFKYSDIQSAMIGSSKGAVSVAPNPTTGLIQLKNADAFESLDVYDLNGRLVRQFSNNANQLDISDLPKGVYQITIKAKGTVSFAKVVKM
jgi:hypothetical protein